MKYRSVQHVLSWLVSNLAAGSITDPESCNVHVQSACIWLWTTTLCKDFSPHCGMQLSMRLVDLRTCVFCLVSILRVYTDTDTDTDTTADCMFLCCTLSHRIVECGVTKWSSSSFLRQARTRLEFSIKKHDDDTMIRRQNPDFQNVVLGGFSFVNFVVLVVGFAD